MVYFALLTAGLASGFLAGLLGIGGGFVVVPVLMVLLPAVGIDPGLVPKVAVATSLAAMVPTACSAVYAQHRRGILDTRWLRRLAPGAAIGAAVGSQLAAAVSGPWVAIIFAAYAGYFALKMLRNPTVVVAPAGLAACTIVALPAPLAGALIGTFSALAGVGGASLTVPYLLLAGVEIKRAVALASAVGLAIALPGAVGYASASLGTSAPGSSLLIGLVHWPVALTLAASAVAMAPRGVAVSHALPMQHLKRAFGAVLLVTCAVTLAKAVDSIDGFDHVVALAALKIR
jgi:uncharacterized membrane protein YfcA